MSLNGKRDDFDVDDLYAFAASAGLKKARARALLADVAGALHTWGAHAETAGIVRRDSDRIARTFRTQLAS